MSNHQLLWIELISLPAPSNQNTVNQNFSYLPNLSNQYPISDVESNKPTWSSIGVLEIVADPEYLQAISFLTLEEFHNRLKSLDCSISQDRQPQFSPFYPVSPSSPIFLLKTIGSGVRSSNQDFLELGKLNLNNLTNLVNLANLDNLSAINPVCCFFATLQISINPNKIRATDTCSQDSIADASNFDSNSEFNSSSYSSNSKLFLPLELSFKYFQAYFLGQDNLEELEPPVNWAQLDKQPTAFQLAVYQEIKNIPRGELITYGELASRIGNPSASRAVGNALNKNPFLILYPCHRIVGASKKAGGFAYGMELKNLLIDLELRF